MKAALSGVGWNRRQKHRTTEPGCSHYIQGSQNSHWNSAFNAHLYTYNPKMPPSEKRTLQNTRIDSSIPTDSPPAYENTILPATNPWTDTPSSSRLTQQQPTTLHSARQRLTHHGPLGPSIYLAPFPVYIVFKDNVLTSKR